MRKDPEKKQAGKERRKKRLAAIISICLSIAVVITAIAGTIAYTMTNQLPQDEKQFSEKERKVLLQRVQFFQVIPDLPVYFQSKLFTY